MLKDKDPDLFKAIEGEERRQREKLELIASENFASPEVLEAQGSVLTNKYAEGYPRARYYGGCEYVDIAESLAMERVNKLFGADYANVQPHSGSQANMAVYFTAIKPGDTIMGMDLAHGGHLTHGAKVNFSGQLYEVVAYGVDEKTETIDYNQVEEIAMKARPDLIVAGASAYPRSIDFEPFAYIAERCGAYLMVDMAHIAGLVATGAHPTPAGHADYITSTTHKTLRGPRGGFILAKGKYEKKLNREVFPGMQGGPLMHTIAAKAVAFGEALTQDFRDYIAQVVKNADRLAEKLRDAGFRIVSGGTDNHMFLVDLTPRGLTGREAEDALGFAGITVNKNKIPFDKLGANDTSGIRIGTPACTTRGMVASDMETAADFMIRALGRTDDMDYLKGLRAEVREFCLSFPQFVPSPKKRPAA